MAIPTTIESLSTTAASNGPSGSDQRNTADDGLRQAYAFIKQSVSQGSDLASASTITPPSTGSFFDITGTTAITTIASTNSWDGRVIGLQFDGALVLTHGSNLSLPGSANITTAAGDIAYFVQRGSGAWRCWNYQRADGSLPNSGVSIASGKTLTASNTLTLAGTDGTTITFPSTSTTFGFGTYTPSYTEIGNVTGTPTVGTFKWLRVGSVVHVSGVVSSVQPTVGANDVEYQLSLPVASNFTSSLNDCTGVVSVPGSTISGQVIADPSTDKADVSYIQGDTTAHSNFVMFSYVIL